MKIMLRVYYTEFKYCKGINLCKSIKYVNTELTYVSLLIYANTLTYAKHDHMHMQK